MSALRDFATRELNAVQDWLNANGPKDPVAQEEWWRKNASELGREYIRGDGMPPRRPPPDTIARASEKAITQGSIRSIQSILITSRSATARVAEELDLVARRLVSDHPAHFGEIDRLRAEGEFRTAIGIPLAVVSVVTAQGLDVSASVVFTVGLIATAVAVFMHFTGWGKSSAANDQLGTSWRWA